MKNSMMNATPSPLVRSLRTASPLVGLTLLTLSLVACGGGSSAPSASTPEIPTATEPAPTPSNDASTTAADIALVPYTYDGKDYSWNEQTSGNIVTQALSNGNNDLSAQSWSSATSGWGPVELNRSNGEMGGADGHTLTLDGNKYATGLGVHSASTITYDLNGQCAGFQSDVGIDDEVRSLGSVTFEIWADGTKLFDSGVMTGATYRKFTSVNLTGKKQLKLVVTNAGDNANYDHADWAGATLLGCSISGGKTSVTPPPPVPVTSNVSYAGPLIITKGGTYSGNWESQDPNKPVISVQTSDPVIIENSNIRGRGNLIVGYGNRLTVRNVNGYGLNPNVAGRIPGKFAVLEEIKNINIQNNYIESTSGIYIRSYKGDPNAGDTIKIIRNKVVNTDGRQSNGNGGFTTKTNITQTILFNQVQRIPNVEIAWNQVINEPGKSAMEENYNMYASSGTSASPMLIHDNYIQGAYNAEPWSNPNSSGGGILVGDGQSTNPTDSGYTRVYNNQVVNSSNHSFGITGGIDNQVYNNRAIFSGKLPDGRPIAHNHTTGVVVWDISGLGKYNPPTFFNNVMSNNYFAITNLKSDGSFYFNQPSWTPNCGGGLSTCANNKDGGVATQDMERQEYQNWLAKLNANGIKVGP